MRDDPDGDPNVVAYTTELAVSNPDGRLNPGMTATATILTDSIKNILLVPNAALRFTADAAAPQEKYVWRTP